MSIMTFVISLKSHLFDHMLLRAAGFFTMLVIYLISYVLIIRPKLLKDQPHGNAECILNIHGLYKEILFLYTITSITLIII